MYTAHFHKLPSFSNPKVLSPVRRFSRVNHPFHMKVQATSSFVIFRQESQWRQAALLTPHSMGYVVGAYNHFTTVTINVPAPEAMTSPLADGISLKFLLHSRLSYVMILLAVTSRSTCAS